MVKSTSDKEQVRRSRSRSKTKRHSKSRERRRSHSRYRYHTKRERSRDRKHSRHQRSKEKRENKSSRDLKKEDGSVGKNRASYILYPPRKNLGYQLSPKSHAIKAAEFEYQLKKRNRDGMPERTESYRS